MSHLTKILGLKALQRIIDFTVSKKVRGEWIDINIQPKRDLNPKNVHVRPLAWKPEDILKYVKICPHYEFLAMLAEIFLISAEEFTNIPNFCGIIKSPIMVGDRHGRNLEEGGVDEEPFAVCRALHFLMCGVSDTLQVEEPANLIINSESNTDDLEKAEKEIYRWQKFLLKKKLLVHFQQAIPKIIQVEISESEERIAEIINNLHQRLKDQITGNNDTWWKPVCGVAPKAEHNQWLHVD